MKETFSKWINGKKLGLTVGYWFFSFVAGGVLYINADTFDEKLSALTMGLEWSFYAFMAFVGAQGVIDGIEMIKKPKSPGKSDTYNTEATDTA